MDTTWLGTSALAVSMLDRGGVLTPLNRIPLEGGSSVLVEDPTGALEGPVKAGRIGEAVHELPMTLQEALEPVTKAAHAALDQLRKTRPDDITVEFGVDLGVEAGAVITKSQASCHLRVTLSWSKGGPGRPQADESAG
ncbi:CU044_2847 family protein [Streptomyces osmaniensis]|uniref:Trypsin-co-occurring domain-containing protein n=1 Tax=Streptomyces osmaniensis TaxID=593134 RepID=A0ABP6WQ19_9ACTN